MHSLFSRINNASALLSSCTMALLAFIALSSFMFTADPKGELAIASVKVCVCSIWRDLLMEFRRAVQIPYSQTTRVEQKTRACLCQLQHHCRWDFFCVGFGRCRILIFVDLTPLFHWNTKQLFLYLEAEYTNGEAVSFAIWDVVSPILSFLRWIILRACLGLVDKGC